jgi:hypothetical protein
LGSDPLMRMFQLADCIELHQMCLHSGRNLVAGTNRDRAGRLVDVEPRRQ